MKVLHIITGLGIGGAEQQLRLLLRQLPTNSEVITLTNPGAVAEGIVADGVPVTDLDMAGNRDLGALPRLARLIKRGRYDLVHTHLYRACLYGRFAARLAGVRTIVATEHSLGAVQIEGRPLSSGARALYLAGERLGTATVAVSATVARRLERWGVRPDRIHVVPNGIEVGRFAYDETARRVARTRLGVPQDAFVVGGVGRLNGGKRFDRLVRAVAELPGARLLLIGEGPERDRLLRLARDRGAADRILLHGACQDPPPPRAAHPSQHGPDLPSLLAAMDVFVSTSPDEAFGLAVVEGLAAGLPVLHVTCPALQDLPADAAPGARRVSGSVPGLVDELRRFEQAGPHRLPVPPAARHYDIAHSARQLMTVYENAVRDPAPLREVSCS
ncbi:glycosyltransferase [Streptomyces scopuliridis]|uniref:D-inositol 3-phosphate glycosyltransferase n=1 Tax=Streptomyces scopuliridis RB72 TaxID=1440053 RepID=A0A2T7SU10_9ACTN|nr:glycosyltransferase [Streptomyces scopuliridis]PVE06377.1 glycosyl transferase [Streptomyces scopuliridis RB72]